MRTAQKWILEVWLSNRFLCLIAAAVGHNPTIRAAEADARGKWMKMKLQRERPKGGKNGEISGQQNNADKGMHTRAVCNTNEQRVKNSHMEKFKSFGQLQ